PMTTSPTVPVPPTGMRISAGLKTAAATPPAPPGTAPGALLRGTSPGEPPIVADASSWGTPAIGEGDGLGAGSTGGATPAGGPTPEAGGMRGGAPGGGTGGESEPGAGPPDGGDAGGGAGAAGGGLV